MRALLVCLLLVGCEPSPRTVFCRVYASLGCSRVWKQDCVAAYAELERSGHAFCPLKAPAARDCDDLAAVTHCPWTPPAF